MNGKCRKILGWIIILIVFLIPLTVYFYQFHYLSDDPNDWGAFGAYVGGVYSVFVAIFVIMLTRSLEKKDQIQKDKQATAKALYKQIVEVKETMKQNSIDKLVKDINASELYLPEKLIKKLRALYDSFVESKANSAGADYNQVSDVLGDLKDIYNEYGF